jgi:hypothetical protein
MADIMRGLKAGALAGAVMGILGGIIIVILMFTLLHGEYAAIFEQTLATMPPGAEISIDTLIMISAVFSIIGGLVIGVIFGVVFGIIYAVLYDKIPGKTAIAKGIVTGLAYFVISTVFSLLMQMAFSGQQAAMGVEQSALMTGTNYVTGFIEAIIFGYLLGWLWIKFEPKE